MSDVSTDAITSLGPQPTPAPSGKDRRIFQRFWEDAPLEVLSEGSTTPIRARASNISIGGIGFLSREWLEDGSRVTITAHFANSPSVTLVADIVHSVESDGVWEHGAIFHSEPSIELVYHICEAYELRRFCK